jgi:hypothetical protein
LGVARRARHDFVRMSFRAVLAWLRLVPIRVVALVLFVFGCAREAPEARTARDSFQPWVASRDYEWPPRVVKKRDRMRPGASARTLTQIDPITTPNRPPLLSDAALPGGEACLERLRSSDVAFRPMQRERGVETPIVIQGPIRGVEFWSPAGPMIVDCRFALGLWQVAPALTELGIRRVRFSGAYVYRTSRKGRLSLHAYGLALDVHEVTTADGTFSVKRDFARGLGSGCGAGAPLLNQLSCRLRAPGLFRELLTPDYNSDHHDHLHLGIAPLPSSTPERRADTGPTPAARPSREASKLEPRKKERLRERENRRSARLHEHPPQDRLRKRRAQVKTARQGGHPPAIGVDSSPSSARIARLWADLEAATKVPGDRVHAPAPDDSDELLPIEPQQRDLLGARTPEQGSADATVGEHEGARALDGHPQHPGELPPHP